MNYQYTMIEDQVKNIYKHLRIDQPEQLDLIKIASLLNVWVHFGNFESRHINRGGLYSIVINRNLTSAEQWQDFAHELGHVINHEGNQLNLPESFIEFQEYKANNFMMHFCVPTFMLNKLKLPPYIDPVDYVMSTFNVTYELAKQRLDHYNRQISQSMYDKRIRRHFSIKTKPFNLENCSEETKRIMNKLQNQLYGKEIILDGN